MATVTVSTRNLRVVLPLAAAAFLMLGAAYASVPLYRWFCQVTGFAGTTQRAAEAPAAPVARTIAVRFDANVARDLPWRFQPVEREVRLPIGEQRTAFYRARNLSDRPLTGQATFNVTPGAAGVYFSKIDCFCFTRQRLGPGESADMGVTFFVDPAILDDPETAGLAAITLSYTFFRAPDEAAAEPDAAGGSASLD